MKATRKWSGKEARSALGQLHQSHTLAELKERFPDEWETVSADLAEVVSSGKPEQLQHYLAGLAATEAVQENRVGRRPNRQAMESAAVGRLIRHRMAHLAVKGYLLSAAAGGRGGKIRFNWFNGFIAQRLLFARDLERKPVSMFWFRLFWPLLWQKKRLMPLVEAKGIYCFYSKPLIASLALLIGERTCLEIGAGDGTLSRFLAAEGVRITATDNYSWKHAVSYQEDVLKLDAAQALSQFRPAVVICSWPPANNSFERLVFTTPGVDLYIVIGSKHTFASGNWVDYRANQQFDLREDIELGRGVLPPELAATVYLFQRRAALTDASGLSMTGVNL